ncbi:MAG TPA: hypothetical protein VKU02_01475 [Gemmataceae bacterium]|nr:hypothetical protein [Gemmataceae bacterium]
MQEPEVLENQTSSRGRIRWRRHLGIGIALVLGFLVGEIFLTFYWAGQQLTKTLAELDRADPGWRLEDLEARRPVLADEENSALRALAAHALLPSPWPTNPPEDEPTLEISTRDLAPTMQLSAQQLKLLTAAMTEAEAAVKEAHTLANMPRGRHTIVYLPNTIAILLPHVQPVRQIANVLTYDAMLRAQLGDVDGALESCRAGVNAGRSLGEEPFLISQLVRMAIRAIIHRSIERTLAQGEPSQAALEALQRLLEEDEPEPLLLYGSRGERALMDKFIVAGQSGQMTHAELTKAMAALGLPGNELGVLFFVGTARHNRIALLEFESRMVELAKLSGPKQSEQLQPLERSAKDLPFITRLLVPAFAKVAEAHHRTLAELRCDIVALAAERYRRSHGDWPTALAELLPEDLKQIPADPFDDQPLRYRRLTDGVVIYSIGLDRQDNGGNVDRSQPYAPGTDIGIRLWDLPHRRRPARP